MVTTNKKGWIRIMESFVAILIVVGAVLIVMQTKSKQKEQSFCDILPEILDEIAKNESMRQSILSEDIASVIEYSQNKIRNPSFVFKAKICPPDDACILDRSGGLDKVDICAEQRIIGTNKDSSSFSPRKIRLFLLKV